jgi:hypothetical protein
MYKYFNEAMLTIKSQGLSHNFLLVFNMRNQSYAYRHLATHMYIKTNTSESNEIGFSQSHTALMFCISPADGLRPKLFATV